VFVGYVLFFQAQKLMSTIQALIFRAIDKLSTKNLLSK
jgi:hypothetical protein